MRIVVSSEPRLLHILRAVVRWHATEAGFTEPEVENLALAVSEAAANVIRHTYKGRSDCRLSLEVVHFPDRMELVLEDSGPKIVPGQIRHRPLDDVRPGGLGTYFINAFVDSCTYDPDFPDGNRLRMLKYLPRKVSV